jgi:uncharacterized protein YciI
MYFLVQLHDTPDGPAVFGPDHEPFIDELIAANVALIGGPFDDPPGAGVRAAYVLRCATFDEARAIAERDPTVTAGRAIPSVHAWHILAINPAAADANLVFTPDDIKPR